MSNNLPNHVYEFLEKYDELFNDNENQRLDLEIDTELPKGNFNKYSMGVSFSGLKLKSINDFKQTIEYIEKNHNDSNTQYSMTEILKKYPDIKKGLIYQEVFTHEFFHFFQCLTLQAPNVLLQSSRAITYIRTMAFLVYVMSSGTYKVNDNSYQSIVSYVKKMPNTENRRMIADLMESSVEDLGLIKRFFNDKDTESSLTMRDIFESSAYAYQKIVNGTIELDLFNAPNDSFYKKAFNYFDNKVNNSCLNLNSESERLCLFLVLTNLSLKYGHLSDDDFSEFFPTPQELFTHLCANLGIYSEIINEINEGYEGFQINNAFLEMKSDLKSLSFSKKLDISSQIIEYFDRFNLSISRSEIDFLLSLDTSTEQQFMIAGLSKVVEKAKYEIKSFYDYKKVKFSEEFDLNSSDTMLNSVSENLLELYPNLTSDLFFVSLISVPNWSMKFIMRDLSKISSTEFKGFMNRKLSIQDENVLFDFVNRLEDYIKGFPIYCCENHGKSTYSILSKCQNSGSFQHILESLTGKSLSEIIE